MRGWQNNNSKQTSETCLQPSRFPILVDSSMSMTDHCQTQDPKPTKAGSSAGGYSSGPKYPNPPELTGYSSGTKYPNPPELTNPDPITLREQWKFATKQYSRWYSRAWGTAILAGLAFFVSGWIVKGSNPFPSKSENHEKNENKSSPQ